MKWTLCWLSLLFVCVESGSHALVVSEPVVSEAFTPLIINEDGTLMLGNGPDSSNIIIFTYTALIWERKKLQPPDLDGVYSFGSCVAVSRDDSMIAVGGCRNEVGSIFIYTRPSTVSAWEHTETLTLHTTCSLKGGAPSLVKFSGNLERLFVSGIYYEQPVSVFTRVGPRKWSEPRHIPAPEPKETFGMFLTTSFEGRKVSVGTWNCAEYPVYTFVLEDDGTNWSQVDRMVTNEAKGRIQMSDDGGTLVLGQNVYGKSNKVYIFQNQEEKWKQSSVITGPHPEEVTHFGRFSLSGDGQTIAISAPYETSIIDGTQLRGAVYLYRLENGSWKKIIRIEPKNAPQCHFFGSPIMNANATVLTVISNVFHPDAPPKQGRRFCSAGFSGRPRKPTVLYIYSLLAEPTPARAGSEGNQTNLGDGSLLCIPPPSGLISWWPGDGNAKDIIGQNNGELHNGATFGSGMVGQAFSFDGVDDFVQATTVGLPVGNSDRTMELWVYLKTPSPARMFFAGYGKQRHASQFHFGTYVQPNKISFNTYHPGVDGSSLDTQRWYHVSVTSIRQQVRIYIDGAEVANKRLEMDTAADSHLKIGRWLDPLSKGNGLVDEVSVYNRALSAAEIKSIFDAGKAGKCKHAPKPCIPPPAGLVSWWTGDGNAKDIAGPNDGELHNGATYADGMVGKAFKFDGRTSVVKVPTTLLSTPVFTIEAWIWLEQSSKYRTIFHRNVGGGFWLWNSRLNWWQGNKDRFLGKSTIITNAWHHVALSYSGETFIGFLDGGIDGQSRFSGAKLEPTGGTLGGHGGETFHGLVDEVSIYNRALSATEIKSIYDAGKAGKCKTSVLASTLSGVFEVHYPEFGKVFYGPAAFSWKTGQRPDQIAYSVKKIGNTDWTLVVNEGLLEIISNSPGCCTKGGAGKDFWSGLVLTFPELLLDEVSLISTNIKNFEAARVSHTSHSVKVRVGGGLDLRNNRKISIRFSFRKNTKPSHHPTTVDETLSHLPLVLPSDQPVQQSQSPPSTHVQHHHWLTISHAIVAGAALLLGLLLAYLYVTRCKRQVARTVKVYVRDSSGGEAETHITSMYEGESGATFRKRVLREIGKPHAEVELMDEEETVVLTDHTPLPEIMPNVRSIHIRKRRSNSDEDRTLQV